MTPKPRSKRNRGLPAGWRHKNGWYCYRTNRHTRRLFDGKGEFPLGKTLGAAHKTFGERMAGMSSDTMPRLLDRYEVEITPDKAESTQAKERKRIARLRQIFEKMTVPEVQAHHCYKVRDALHKKHGARTANLHMALLSHVLTKAVEWGERPDHPMIRGKFKKLPVEAVRHVPEAWEIDEALTVAPPLIRAYVGLKRITGLRMGDMLSIRRDDIQGDVLHVRPRKTAQSSGKAQDWTIDEDLRAALDACLALQVGPKRVAGAHLFCTRKGQPYTPDGFASIWQRWMKKALTETKLEKRFNERSLRTYVGSWSESDQDAADRLGHASTTTTKRHYRERPTVVTTLKVEK